MATSVSEIMTRDPVTVDASTSLADCARLMESRNIGALGVENKGRLCGVLTDRDIVIRAVARGRDPQATPAGELCIGDPVTIYPNASVAEAERVMSENRVRRLFVMGDGGPVGIVAADDLIAALHPDSVHAHQLDEAGVLRGDQGHTGQAE